jgi:hypothetical protein
MRKNRIKLLNNKYIIAYHTRINKGTKVFLQSKIIWVNIYQLLINVVLKLAAQIRIIQRGERNGAPKSNVLIYWSPVANPKSGPDFSAFIMK